MGTKLLKGFTSFDSSEGFSSSEEDSPEGLFFLDFFTLRDLPRFSNVKVRKSY